MANASKGSSGNPQREEKKDSPPHAKRSDHRGSQSHENIESPQLDQAFGKRTVHSRPGANGSQDSGEPSRPEKNPHNNRSGGSRPKGRQKHGSMGDVDHN